MFDKNSPEMKRKCVWKTANGKQCIFLYECENPNPAKPLISLSMYSADSVSQPLIGGITAIPSDDKKEFSNSINIDAKMVGKVIRGKYNAADNSFKFAHQMVINLKEVVDIPKDKLSSAVLRFEVRNNPDEWGTVRPRTYLPVGISGFIKGEKANNLPGVSTRTSNLINQIFSKYTNPGHFAEIEIPLTEMLRSKSKNHTGNMEKINAVSFGPWGQQPFSRTVRNVRFEY